MLRIHCKIALCFLISLFDLSAILKIRNGEHAHYVGLVVAYIWNREKQMFVALGKEFDMVSLFLLPRGYFFCRDSCGPPYILNKGEKTFLLL